MGPEMSAVFVPLGSFVMVVFIIWFATRQKQAQIQARTDLHKHLLDKFGSGNELAEFLESEGGKKMLGELGEEKVSPRERAMKYFRAGVIIGGLGAAFLALTFKEPDLVIPGGLLLGLGMGFLIAAWATRRWSRDSELAEPEGKRSPAQ